MGLSPLLILLLFGTIGAMATRFNECKTDITGMKNYINHGVDVPLSKLADVVLSPIPFPLRYASLLNGTKYEQLSSSIRNVTVSPWIDVDGQPGWIQRNVSYFRDIDTLLLSTSNIIERFFLFFISKEQMVKYDEATLTISKTSGSVESLLSGFSVRVEYCATPGQVYYTNLQVDISLKFLNPLFGILSKQIEEKAHEGFLYNYGALDRVLSKLPEVEGYPYLLEVTPNPPANTVPVLTFPTDTPSTVKVRTSAVKEEDWSMMPWLKLAGFFIVLAVTYVVYKKGCHFLRARLMAHRQHRRTHSRRRRIEEHSRRVTEYHRAAGFEEIPSLPRVTSPPVVQDDSMEEVLLA